MKKRLLIICSIIGVLLAGFQFPIYAEETAPDYSSSTSIVTSAALDQYFYDNYDLLPYIESNGDQYISTGINGNNNILVNFKISDLYHSDVYKSLIGSVGNGRYYLDYKYSTDNSLHIGFGSANKYLTYTIQDYTIYDFKIDRNNFYINDILIDTLTNNEFNNNQSIYIFASNTTGSASDFSSYKLYGFSIYDYAANEGEGALVRDYYPAKSKSGGVIGLYDAVSKTFITTSGSVPFASPTGDPVNLSLGANITQFLSGSLSWIGVIFEGINEMPIIWVFIAIALAGVMFRWARRLVHF